MSVGERQPSKEIVDRMSEVVFTNFSDEVFYGKWAKRLYELKSKKAVYLPFYLAENFAKHLVNREITRIAKEARQKAVTSQPNIHPKELDNVELRFYSNLQLKQELMDKCVEKQNLEGGDVSIVRPREVDRKQRPPLKTEERAAELVRQGVPASEFAHVTPRTADEEFE